MQINKNNYEEYAIDWLEGNLDAEDLKNMEAFLSANPDIRSDLGGLEEMVLTPSLTDFPKKEQLFKKEKAAFPWALAITFLVIPAIFILIFYSVYYMNKYEIGESENEKIYSELNTYQIEREYDSKTLNSMEDQKKEPKKATKDSNSSNTEQSNTIPKVYNNRQPIINNNIIKKTAENQMNPLFPELKKQSETDSLRKVLDSIQQLRGVPKVEWKQQPMAQIDLKYLKIQRNSIDAPADKILIQTMLLDFKQETRRGFAVKKSKGIKTPFGTIRFKEIREALLPESYFASDKKQITQN